MRISEARQNLDNCIAAVRLHKSNRHVQNWSLTKEESKDRNDLLRIAPAEYVASALYDFGLFGGIADRHGGHLEDAAFFPSGAAIGENTQGVLLERDKIDESKRHHVPNKRMLERGTEILDQE
jgi:hypothetical protein